MSRSWLRRTVAAACCLVLTGCGSADEPASSDSAPGGTRSGSGSATVDSAFGPVSVPKNPGRVVVLGTEYVDMLLTLGVQPAAYASAFGKQKSLKEEAPWVEGKATGANDPKLYDGDYKASVEAVAKHRPDLIIGAPGQFDEKRVNELKKVAPVYVTPGYTANGWRQDLRRLGELTGTQAKAKEALRKVDGAFAAQKKKLPGLQGKTFAGGIYNVADGATRLVFDYAWVKQLGLKLAANQPKPGGRPTPIAQENLPRLDSDVLLLKSDDPAPAKLTGDPRYGSLPSVKNGTLIIGDEAIGGAGVSASPASLTWLLGEIGPQLEKSRLNQQG